MVTAFSIKNFRGFRDQSTLPVGGLTCLVGRNSSGKSSLIHALLLLRQSVDQRAVGTRVPQLNMNGPLVNAGAYDDIVHNHITTQHIQFTFEITSDACIEPRQSSISKSLVPLDIPRPQINRLARRTYSSACMNYGIDNTKPPVSVVKLSFHPEPPFGPTLSRYEIEVKGLGRVVFVRTTGKTRVQHWRAYLFDLPRKSIRILFPTWSFFPILRERDSHEISKPEQSRIRQFRSVFEDTLGQITTFLTDFKFVGPFRTPPARRYTFSGIGAADTGTSGERAVDLLITEQLLAPSHQYLISAVSHWLNHMGLAKKVRVKHLAKRSSIFELSIAGAGLAKSANFVDVGFGISQILPVLVQGLLVPRGGTYIVQQPELHLHPDAQAALADYFIYLASQGIASIVETHSEYLLLRIRRRLAEGVIPIRLNLPGEKEPIPINNSSISTIYVGEKDNAAVLTPLEIGKSFQFENLPPGFMNQAIDDRLALMKALRKS